MELPVVITLGEKRLHGVFHNSSTIYNEKSPLVIICHGFISSKVGQHRLFVKTARRLCDAGFSVLRFDYSGCGESSGEHEDITLGQQVDETVGVIDYAVANLDIDKDSIILLGHSFGGCVAAITAGLDRRVKRLVLWSPVAQPYVDIVGIVGEKLYQDSLAGKEVDYEGFELGRGFFLSLSETLQPLDKVRHFGGPVLIVHGTADAETPLANTGLYEEVLRDRRSGSQTVRIIDGADHTYASPVWEKSAIVHTARWLKRTQPQKRSNYLAIVGY